MNFHQYIEWLEAKPADANGNPGHAAAVCVSAEDFKTIKIELEQMCRMLGDKCKYEILK